MERDTRARGSSSRCGVGRRYARHVGRRCSRPKTLSVGRNPRHRAGRRADPYPPVGSTATTMEYGHGAVQQQASAVRRTLDEAESSIWGLGSCFAPRKPAGLASGGYRAPYYDF